MLDTLQIFGGLGFVGSAYVRKYPSCIVNEREDYKVTSKNVLYLISTVSNYNVKTDPYLDINTNLITLIRVLEQCKQKNVIFNFISSWFVYGATEMPAKETTYCDPKGFYSITKRCAEQLLISYCETFEIRYRILRLANVAGKGDKKASLQKNALQHMINELKRDRNINLYDSGEFYRDYIHVEDVADAINLILEKGEFNTIYNVGNGIPLLFKNMIEYAYELIGGKGKLIPIEVPSFHKIVQTKSMYMVNDKLKELGYSPKYDMNKIIEDMVS